jgi:hypothetical protein
MRRRVDNIKMYPGKLVDENQLGGLSSLLASLPTTPTTSASPSIPKPPKKLYLQETMGLPDTEAGNFSPLRPEQLWDPSSLLSNGYQRLFPCG